MVWEVAFAANSSVLRGGRSRVYSLDASIPHTKYLIYDETQEGERAVHYPRAVTNSGEIILDQFLPNSGSGWAYGMSVSDFKGGTKEEIIEMQNGSYGTQPYLSPKDDELVFAGYDGSLGPGTEEKNGYRQATITPNTIETYNLKTKTRSKIASVPTTHIYPAVEWDEQSGKIVFSLLSKDGSVDGIYTLDDSKKIVQKVDLGSSQNYAASLLGIFPDGTKLVGYSDTASTTLGNLGWSYASPIVGFSLLSEDGAIGRITTHDTFMQYVGVVENSYFKGAAQVLGTQTSAGNPFFDAALKNLQLQTFFFKPSLAPQRQEQQQGGRCRDLSTAQCEAMGFVNPNPNGRIPVDVAKGESDPKNPFEQCLQRQFQINRQLKRTEGICYDSPLYLYGPTGKEVAVTINTPIYSSVPNHRDNTYKVALLSGKLKIDDGIYDSISYDYTPGIKNLSFPKSGAIAEYHELENVLSLYGKKLGLNKKETDDLISFAQEKIRSPWVFLSFFDQKTSERILPIAFTPHPDTYINIVFYFKQLYTPPTFSPKSPEFPVLVQRSGFTAVEVSAIVQ